MAKTKLSELDKAQIVEQKFKTWREAAERGVTPKDRKRGRDNARRLAKRHGWTI